MGRQSQPRRKPKEERVLMSEKLKNRLYPVVLELFSQKDAYQVTIESIAHGSRVSSGTIYKYFASKEDLLFTIIEEKLEELSLLIRVHVQGLESAKEIFRKLLWVVMDFYDKNPNVAITAFITLPMRTWMQQEGFRNSSAKNLFEDIIQKGLRNGEIDKQIDVRRFQDIYYMICYRMIHTWYYFGMKWKLVEALSNDFDVFWKLFQPVEDLKER
ncbi:MAG: TetR/AcrR family transcriptional regulator [Deltaproteobacteria bacterium]|nr:TetR/AcrR family transcriptional regulator [Deltaproteobacteria bacterium]